MNKGSRRSAVLCLGLLLGLAGCGGQKDVTLFGTPPPEGWIHFLGAVAQVGQKVYFIGGTDYEWVDQDDVTVYNMATDTWSQAAPMPTARCNLGAVVVGTGIYALGGNSVKVEYYDTVGDQWTAKGDIPINAQYPNQFTSCDGKVYAISTPGGTTPNYAVYIYDGGEWTSHTSTYPADTEPALVAGDGKVFILGGDYSETDEDAFIRFDPADNTFTKMTSHALQTGRGYLNTCFSFNGKIYKINTIASDDYYMEIYDIKTNSWATVAIPCEVQGNSYYWPILVDQDVGLYYLFDNTLPQDGFYYNCTTGQFSQG